MAEIYYHNVQYRWSIKRGNAKHNTYKDDYAISVASDLDGLNQDHTNFAFVKSRLGLNGKKIDTLEVVKIYDSKVVGQTPE
jgi:hypothetical protein